MATYYTTQAFESEDGQQVPKAAVVEVADNKQFILKAHWSTKIKGGKKPIDYWFRIRKIKLSQDQRDQFLKPFVIDPQEIRLE